MRRVPLILLLALCPACGKTPLEYPPALEPPKAALPPSAYRVRWVEHDFPARARRSSTLRGRLGFVNAGDGIWTGWVQCAYYFVPAGQKATQEGRVAPRLSLKRPVAPGQRVTFDWLTLATPERAGDYSLVFDLVNETVAWFSDRGGERLVIPIRIE